MEKETKLIWFDFDNAPHVPVLLPIVEEMRYRGYKTILSARDKSETKELLFLRGEKHKLFGASFPKNKFLKTYLTFKRSLSIIHYLIKNNLKNKICLCVNHGSRSALFASWLLGIPSVLLADYEYSNTILGNIFAKKFLMPECICKERLKKAGIKTNKVDFYPGIKEQIYIDSNIKKSDVLKYLKIDKNKIIIVFRPPSTTAHYHNPTSEIIMKKIFDEISCYREKVFLIVLPRTKSQKGKISNLLTQKSIPYLIPENPLNGIDLIINSDLVLGGGGTITREAAVLGVPSYSFFTGKKAAVDEFLERSRRLIFVDSISNIEKIKFKKKQKLMDILPGNQKKIITFISDKLESLISKSKKNTLRERIKKDNSLINFLKIPEELITDVFDKSKQEQVADGIVYLLTEEYHSDHYESRIRSFFRDMFYSVKPIIPKHLQIELRKKYLFLQRKYKFPTWPADLSLYEVYRDGIKEILRLVGLTEIPFINFWPKNKKSAFVLTHDVETGMGQRNIWKLKKIEEQLGFRSIWNFVAEKYKLDEGLIKELKRDGFEIGIHGLKHDGKLFRSEEIFLKRVSKINFYLKKYGCSGFRSPVAWRNYEYMQRLDIGYDLSYFDSDIFEVQAGGSLSFHPFFLGKFIELPYTLPQDHTLFILLGEKDSRIWKEKMKIIKKFHGMVLMLVHPDYMANNNFLDIYYDFLAEVKEDNELWHALPRDVAKWWRKRAQRTLKNINGEWKIYPHLEGASIGIIKLKDGKIFFD